MSDSEDDKPLIKALVLTLSNSLQLSSLYVIHLEVVPYCFSSASLILRSFLATSPSQLDILSSISHLHLLHTTYTSTARSNERVKMDDTDTSMTDLNPGVSVRNGPIDDDMDVDAPTTNGNGIKRKSSMNGKSYKDATESEDEDDVPLTKRRRTSKNKASSDSEDDQPLAKKTGRKPPKVTAQQIGEEDDSDIPLTKKLAKEKAVIEKKAETQAKAIRAKANKTAVKAEDTDESDVPLKKKVAPKKKTNGVKKEGSSDDDKPLKKAPAKRAATKSQSATPAASAKKGKKATKEESSEEKEEDDEEQYRWWEDTAKGDGTKKWSTLEHNGVVFPPEYEPLPKNVKMRYDGVPVTLHPEAEEVATFFGGMLNSTHNVENPTFIKNFFGDFKEYLDRTGHGTNAKGEKVKILKFEKCDFKPIFEHFEAERAKKKAMTTAEKKAAKAEKDEAEAPFMFCLWDGRKQKVGNFRVEPPGLFRGRGEHPKTGKVKTRVKPEQVTINIGEEATVPAPPEGHKWKEVRHDNEGTWLAMWQENVNGNYKYVMLAANSDVKGQSDFKKFEKARELKKHIDKIRKDYQRELKDELMANRQRATAVYLIDQFALRAGNEKGDDEADTVGCCSLKFENVTLKPPNKVVFDFLGKDSIRFYDEVDVDPQVFKNLKIFKKAPKKDGDEIFDRLTTSALNKHLSNYMQGLTAKVFRTYNASWTMARLLQDMKAVGTHAEKVKAYNDANRKVAILCNHKRTVAAGHAAQMEKVQDKIDAVKYQQYRVKQMMLALDSKQKKKKGTDWFALPEGLDEEWMKKHHEDLVEQERQKITKKFEKDNEKLKADGEKEMKPKELDERLEVATELEKKLKNELKTKKVEPEGKGPSVEKYEGQIEKLTARINNMELQAEDRESNKEVALGTSKINYIDPRLTVVFSKKFDVPIEKFFSKTLREKFAWAIASVEEDWEF
ncbi:topoisomerase I [Aureobasidium pullulans]|uniref:DNA topoisomerase I n=1 Tax=Aureobasidium pullulans TaxID=5580 RepID=A0AB74JT66_AURPU|nr:topoisomerase I [Aureobasidium pullulans]THX54641.1 topoisomerase I [Aureobasidium pullulans]